MNASELSASCRDVAGAHAAATAIKAMYVPTIRAERCTVMVMLVPHSFLEYPSTRQASDLRCFETMAKS